MKLSTASIHHGLNSVKSFLHRGYHATKSFLGDVDYGVNIARRTLGALSPYLDQLGVAHRPAVRALEGYDSLKLRAIQAHGQGEQAYQAVKAQVPQLNFA